MNDCFVERGEVVRVTQSSLSTDRCVFGKMRKVCGMACAAHFGVIYKKSAEGIVCGA